MSDQKIFYEIQLPKKQMDYAFRLIEVCNVLEVDNTQCMHKLLPPSRKRCPVQAEDQCEFCGLWTCAAHFVHAKQIWIEDKPGFNGLSGFHTSPCEQCARLPKEDVLKLRALRLEINR